MRVFSAFLFIGFLATGGASASSFVMPDELSTAGGSILVLGDTPDSVAAANVGLLHDRVFSLDAGTSGGAATVEAARPISASIIAFGEPPVADEKVAAIPKKQASQSKVATTVPMVIRGGIVGDAFATPTVAAASPQPSEPVPAETPNQDPVVAQQAPRNSGPPAQPDAPAPQPAAPPPPPPGNMPTLRGAE